MSRRRTSLILAAVLGVAAGACESRSFVYRPAISSNAVVAGRPAAHHRIPPEAPRGDVRVATFGFAELTPTDGKGDDVRALHVRMVVSNDSDATWTVDTREQRVALPGNGESRPAYARSDDGQPPLVEIPAHAQRSVDLFFPLPPAMQKASELPSFDTLWTVRAGAELVTQRTPFERLEVTPVYRTTPYYHGWYGWGPPYYHDPYYARGGAFFGMRYTPMFVERPIVIRPAPPPPAAPPPRRVR